MTYRGHIKNGMIVLDESIQLPEGSEVLVQPVGAQVPLTDLLKSVAGKGNDLPVDGSKNHDHYISGAPKR